MVLAYLDLVEFLCDLAESMATVGQSSDNSATLIFSAVDPAQAHSMRNLSALIQ